MSGQQQQDKRVVAGFWRRALAALLDVLLVAVVLAAAELGYLTASGGWSIELDDPAHQIIAAAVGVAALLYDVLLTWRIGGTIGKRALGLTVQSREGGKAGLGQLIARLLGRLVSALPLLLGFFWAAWDARKQTWHDRLADTVVVRDDVPVPRPIATEASTDQGVSEEAAPTENTENTGDTGEIPTTTPPQAPAQPAWPQQAAPEPEPEQQAEPAPQAWSPQQQPPQQQQTPQQQQPPQPQPPQPPQPQPPQQFWPQPQPQWPQPQPQPQPQPGWQGGVPVSGGMTPPPPMPQRNDPNAVAISRAGLGYDAATWLQQVSEQVDPRLDRISATWRTSPQAEASRACAFGLLLGHLARLYPHMRPELNATAELHPSFSTLLEGSRLATLEQIVAEPGRMAAWLGPLVDVQDPDRIRALLD